MKTKETKELKQPKTKKEVVKSAIEWSIVGVFCALAIFMFLFSRQSPTSTNGANIFGRQMYVVASSSMEGTKEFYNEEGHEDYDLKNIKAGDIIFVKNVPTDTEMGTTYGEEYSTFMDNIEVGDVLTFNYQLNGSGSLQVITHRVIAIDNETIPNDIVYTLLGDAVENDPANYQTIKKSQRLVIGKVTSKSTALGWLYTNVFSKKIVVYLVTVIPCFIIIVMEVAKISKIVNKDKQKKIQAASKAEVQSKEDEIAALKAKLAEMEKDNKK